MSQSVCPKAIARMKAQPPGLVMNVSPGRMAQGVIARGFSRLPVIKDMIFLGSFHGLLLRAIKTDKLWVKCRHILRQDCLGVALGIQGYEQHLHLICFGAEEFHYARKLHQGVRTSFGAVRISEKQYNDFTFEIRQGSLLSLMVSQLEAFPGINPGNVHGFK